MIGDEYGYEGEDVAQVPFAELLHQTELAVLIRCEDGEKFWIPKKWVSAETEMFNKGDVGTLVIARWWAVENGLEDAIED